MHYFKRYANHEQSQKFESKLRQTAEEKMRELQIKNKYSSWIDVEHIKKAVEQLIECRNVLKYTYIYGYYMDDGPEKNLFEYLQEDLERVTEHLSGILEGPVEKFDRDEVLNTTKSGQTRLQHLLKGVEQGLTTSK
jgi:ariadne-1